MGFGEETEGKVPLWKPKRRWDNVIKMDFQEVGCRCMHWIEMNQVGSSWRAIAIPEMNFWVQ
jgi:hypothetical protein